MSHFTFTSAFLIIKGNYGSGTLFPMEGSQEEDLSERFIEALDEYYHDDWEAFKSHLLDYYPLKKKNLIIRKLLSIEKFNNYIWEFTVIARALEDRKVLSQTDKYNYFWRGIKPVSFRNKIANVLRNSKQWINLTNPLPMDKATQVIKLWLKRDLYQVLDEHGLSMASGDEESSEVMDSDDDSGLDDLEDESKRVKSKKSQSKVDAKQKKEETVAKPSETKPRTRAIQ
ncbi:hypothetical protein BS47DRAFT_1362538 [Hydnum rufescens UP504]|uniref:Uncharacterized protein n=1 Tax=Hydnum rufescens UP504 TaxID=1448309 RepID=A0A9P6AWY5_9AGAM|nr:hypothetical protein BS47DRAFT_1362538 [Hydnum rufescens UP504]